MFEIGIALLQHLKLVTIAVQLLGRRQYSPLYLPYEISDFLHLLQILARADKHVMTLSHTCIACCALHFAEQLPRAHLGKF